MAWLQDLKNFGGLQNRITLCYDFRRSRIHADRAVCLFGVGKGDWRWLRFSSNLHTATESEILGPSRCQLMRCPCCVSHLPSRCQSDAADQHGQGANSSSLATKGAGEREREVLEMGGSLLCLKLRAWVAIRYISLYIYIYRIISLYIYIYLSIQLHIYIITYIYNFMYIIMYLIIYLIIYIVTYVYIYVAIYCHTPILKCYGYSNVLLDSRSGWIPISRLSCGRNRGDFQTHETYCGWKQSYTSW